jgi:hypothetical protein
MRVVSETMQFKPAPRHQPRARGHQPLAGPGGAGSPLAPPRGDLRGERLPRQRLRPRAARRRRPPRHRARHRQRPPRGRARRRRPHAGRRPRDGRAHRGRHGATRGCGSTTAATVAQQKVTRDTLFRRLGLDAINVAPTARTSPPSRSSSAAAPEGCTPDELPPDRPLRRWGSGAGPHPIGLLAQPALRRWGSGAALTPSGSAWRSQPCVAGVRALALTPGNNKSAPRTLSGAVGPKLSRSSGRCRRCGADCRESASLSDSPGQCPGRRLVIAWGEGQRPNPSDAAACPTPGRFNRQLASGIALARSPRTLSRLRAGRLGRRRRLAPRGPCVRSRRGGVRRRPLPADRAPTITATVEPAQPQVGDRVRVTWVSLPHQRPRGVRPRRGGYQQAAIELEYAREQPERDRACADGDGDCAPR